MVDRDKRYIDPMFYLPEGMDERVWAYRETPDETLDEEAPEEGLDGTADVTIIDEGDASTDDTPLTVDNLEIISQVIRRAADGTQVVDIVAEVDDVPGITKYEFRITKI